MLLNASEVSNDIVFVLGKAFADGSYMSGPCKIDFENVIDERWWGFIREALKDFGERKKSKDQDFCACESRLVEPFDSNCVRRFDVLGRCGASRGRRSGSMGLKDTAGSFSSSRTSLIVNDA